MEGKCKGLFIFYIIFNNNKIINSFLYLLIEEVYVNSILVCYKNMPHDCHLYIFSNCLIKLLNS